MKAFCDLCKHPIDFNDPGSYVRSDWRSTYYCSLANTDCEKRRGIKHSVKVPPKMIQQEREQVF